MIAVSQSTHKGMTWIHSSLLHPCMLDYFYTCCVAMQEYIIKTEGECPILL